LEGKKMYLEGTWRVVVGHLEGKGQSLCILVCQYFIAKTTPTWRVFGKKIYREKHIGAL